MNRHTKNLGISCLMLALSGGVYAQDAHVVPAAGLPAAPMPQPVVLTGASAGPQAAQASATSAPGTPTILSVKDAQALALKNNPQISVARLTALASQEVTREVRSSLWPTATADLTGVDSKENSRITAGGLNNPV